MDLKKATPDEKYHVCKRYYIGGMFCLPWLWLINAVWFGKEAFKTEADPRIRKMVVFSGIGALIYIIAIAAWASYFQSHRVEMGALGDSLSANIPKGSA
eukprot:m.22836 g.22836  ORF g.22836 m.22836 type:complete len:99 (-) comp13970_c0_seq1:235-531(-)